MEILVEDVMKTTHAYSYKFLKELKIAYICVQSECDRKPLSSRSTVHSVLENVLKKFLKKISLEYNWSSPKSK